jgi:hypothetical protein
MTMDDRNSTICLPLDSPERHHIRLVLDAIRSQRRILKLNSVILRLFTDHVTWLWQEKRIDQSRYVELLSLVATCLARRFFKPDDPVRALKALRMCKNAVTLRDAHRVTRKDYESIATLAFAMYSKRLCLDASIWDGPQPFEETRLRVLDLTRNIDAHGSYQPVS